MESFFPPWKVFTVTLPLVTFFRLLRHSVVRMATHRALVWTSYNLSVLDVLSELNLEESHIRYVVCQVECCPETNRLHVQGYTEFSRPTRVNRWKNLIRDDTCHVERRRGTRIQAREYCLKQDTRQWGPYEYGDWQQGGSGSRNDLLAVKRRLDEGANQITIANEFFEDWCKFSRAFEKYSNLSACQAPALRDVRTTVLWGETGCGKSHRAFHHCPTAYRLAPPNVDNGPLWWDGYDDQATVIIDDFESWISYRTLLMLLDKYPFRCQIKGGVVMARWTHVIITSNICPTQWFPNEHAGPLERRLTVVNHIIDRDSLCYWSDE